MNPEKVHSLMETRSDCSGGWESSEGRQDSGSARGCVKVKRDVRGGGRAETPGGGDRRPGPVSAPGAGGEGRRAPRADGKELRRAGRAARSGRAGRAAVGVGSRGAGPRRRRAGLAPDLTFWVRACVQEARWGRGWGREAVREVPGWLASAPFSLPLLPAPEGTGPQGPRREAGGALPADSRRSRPGPGDTSPSGLWGLLREGAGVVAACWTSPSPASRPSGESRRRLFRDRGWVGPWLDGSSLFPLPLVVSGACGTEGRESGTRAPCTGPELDRALRLLDLSLVGETFPNRGPNLNTSSATSSSNPTPTPPPPTPSPPTDPNLAACD